jgi:5'-phosphate synthase pdxT subunit
MNSAGILALQGDFSAHARMLEALGLAVVLVRSPEELQQAAMLCMPGGESTAMSLLLDESGLRGPLTERISAGMPVFATCAGMILLARELSGDSGSLKVKPLGLLDALVDRNSYGRQIDSFEEDIEVDWQLLGAEAQGRLSGVFIRAPRIVSHGVRAQPVAWHQGQCVALRQGSILAAAFHPEIAGDARLHRCAAGWAGLL